jgi:hypothetical protein
MENDKARFKMNLKNVTESSIVPECSGERRKMTFCNSKELYN